MAWIKGIDDRQFLVEDDGTHWNMNKTLQYDPETLEVMSEDAEFEEIVELKDEVKEGGDINNRMKELDGMQWGPLKKLYKAITGENANGLRKPDIIEGILNKELS
jgi:hypothetical protein